MLTVNFLEPAVKDLIDVLGTTSSKRINNMLGSIFIASEGQNKVEMQPEIHEATMRLREFLFERVYKHKTFRDEEERAKRMLTALYTYYKKAPEKMPEFYVKRLDVDDIDTVLCDYISGMSDMYAVKTFSEIFIPKNWKL